MHEYMAEMGLAKGAISLSTVHTNRPLTNISHAYMTDPAGFVASRIFPVVPVAQQSDLYYKYDRADWNRNEMKKRAPATESAGGTYGVSTDNYYINVYAVHRDVDDQIRANADDVLNIDADATNWVSRKGLIFQEYLWVNSYFKTGVWSFLKTGVSSSPGANQFLQWNDAASEPVKDIKRFKSEMLAATGMKPNVLVLGHTTYETITENDSIIDRIKYGQTPNGPAIVTRQALAQLFEVDRIEVLEAIANTAAEGATEANSFIGSAKAAAMFYVPASPGLMTPSAGYTFSWNGYLGANAVGGRIQQFRMDLVKSDRFELELAFDHKVVSTDLGMFITAAVA